MKLRNLLLVAYHFPPHGGSGVQRAVKVAKYLPDSGWHTHVVTAGHKHYPLLDHELLEEVDQSRIRRVRGWEPGGVASRLCRQFGAGRWSDWLEDRIYWRLERLVQRLKPPETELLWAPAAISTARELIRRHEIEAVVTTSPPNAVHLVGLHLKRRLGVPWIADLRDPILDNFAREPRRLAGLYLRWLEEAVVRASDMVVVTCPDLRLRLLERYGGSEPWRISTITNGFDPADAPMPSRVRRKQAGCERADGTFNVVHAGALYRQQSMEGILEAVRAVRARRPEIAARLRLRLIGSISAEQRRLIRPADAAFLIEAGYRTHREAVEEMAAADALLLVTPSNHGGRYCIPAKTFEYLAFGGHVIAIVHPETALHGLLARAGNVTLLGNGDQAGLAMAIEARFDAWRDGLPEPPRDMEALKPFRRDRLAGRFAELCEACVDQEADLRLIGRLDAAAEAA